MRTTVRGEPLELRNWWPGDECSIARLIEWRDRAVTGAAAALRNVNAVTATLKVGDDFASAAGVSGTLPIHSVENVSHQIDAGTMHGPE